MSSLPKIEIDDKSGFCFGVVTAIHKAEEELQKGSSLFCLGDIVHNAAEVERLRTNGLRTITHDDLKNLQNVKVLLRAHGEPPSTYATARENGIEIIDATCPVVLKLQQRIKEAYDRNKAMGGNLQIVIYGRIGHAEVNGLVGQTEGTAIVIEDTSQLEKIDFSRPVSLYSQTTKSLEGFQRVSEEIRKRIASDVDFQSTDTICRQVANRVNHLRDFAGAHDVILFVAGKKSSNGRILFAQCHDVNVRSHLVSGPEDVEPQWFEDCSSVGICGATSTPRWLMEDVAVHIEKIF